MNPTGLLFDSSLHYLDHLAPFCSLLNWPLLVCDPSIHEIAERFYPGLRLLKAPSTLRLGEWISKQFSHVVSCAPRPLLETVLGSFSFEPLWIPHGNSDKGRIAPYFKALYQDNVLLVYGQKMIDFLQTDTVLAQKNRKMIRVGSFRKLYYEKMRPFYDSLDFGITFKNPSVPILLYTPTWEDAEGNSSLWSAFETLSRTLPTGINFLVKPHPNTIHAHAPRLERLIGQHSRENLQFLLDFVPIYPLLSRCSALLSDRSSIGYDFLHFNRSMLFLNPHPFSTNGQDLLSCGLSVNPEEVFRCNWHRDEERLFEKRRLMASYTFENVPLKELRSKILSATDRSQYKDSAQII